MMVSLTQNYFRLFAKHIGSTSAQSAKHQITSSNATIDCLRLKSRHVVDSGSSTDGVDKRWSNDGKFNVELLERSVRSTSLSHQIRTQRIRPLRVTPL